jgi:branched-chain amino acid transport system substrate-binding protein
LLESRPLHQRLVAARGRSARRGRHKEVAVRSPTPAPRNQTDIGSAGPSRLPSAGPQRLAALAVFAGLLVAGPALAQEGMVKIGFITSLSGPAGIIGQHMKDSVELALDHLGRKVGGLPVEVIYGDDQRKPDVGKQLADEMLKKHKVHFVSGIIWSNIMLAVAPTVTGAGTFMIGTNAGPHELAGKMCHELFFTTSWQNDETPEAMGKYMSDQGLTDVYAMAPNYAAGKDMIQGFKRYFKGRIVNEVYTKLGQQDYQAEISQIRAANPKAVFVFYPGDMGIQFLKQYAQAGLRGQIPLYSVYTVDEISLPAVKEAALGNFETRYWSPDLKNEANQKYVGDFRKKYGYTPSFYGAQSYDGILLIDAAVRAVKGDLSNKKGMIAAMRKADYRSTRGPYTYNVNHFPIQNFYLLKAVQSAGGEYEMQIQKTVFENHKDAYYKECGMKW